MNHQKYEIRVALLGYVSVGKSTVVNALLRGKFTEVSRLRTTAGVNSFRISTLEGSTEDWNPDDATEFRSCFSTLDEIQHDNTQLRKTNNSNLQEKVFDVILDEPLFEMRQDTKLVLIDLPGMNEAGSNDTHFNYVKSNWDTFDCVVVVMDSNQGFNTEEYTNLLKFVKNNNTTMREIPVIIVCNKVDQPYDQEYAALAGEIQKQVEHTFEVTSREEALKITIETHEYGMNTDFQKDFFPIVVSMAAEKAFLYRMSETLDLDTFRDIDVSLINRMGRDAVGSSDWWELTDDQKYGKAYLVVRDRRKFERQMNVSNFDTFLKVLDYCVGGVDTQEYLIKTQLDIALKKLSWKSGLVDQLLQILARSSIVPGKNFGVTERFFANYQRTAAAAKDDLEKCKLRGVNRCMEELVSFVEKLHVAIYGDHGRRTQAASESFSKAVDLMKEMIELLLLFIFHKANEWHMSESAVVVECNYEGGVW